MVGAPNTEIRARSVIAMTMLFSGVAQGFGRFSYSLVIPSLIRTTLHSVVLAGTLGTANVSAYLLGSLVVTTFSRRIEATRLIRIGLVISTSGLLLFAASNTFALFVIAMFAAGFGGALIWIPSPGIAARCVPAERKGWAMGLTGAGIGIAITFAAQLARFATRLPGLWSWKAMWLVEGGIALVAVVIAFVHLPRVTQRYGQKSDGLIPQGGFRDPNLTDVVAHNGRGSLASKVPGRTLLTSIYMIYGFVQSIFLTFVVAALEHDHHYSPAWASVIFAIIGFVSIFGGIVTGRVSDPRRNRGTIMGYGFGAMALACFAVADGSLAVVIGGAVLYGIGMSGVPNLVGAYLGDNLPPEGFAGAFALVTLFFGLAQAIGPQLGGLVEVAKGSFRAEYGAIGVLCMLAMALSFVLDLRHRVSSKGVKPLRY